MWLFKMVKDNITKHLHISIKHVIKLAEHLNSFNINHHIIKMVLTLCERRDFTGH